MTDTCSEKRVRLQIFIEPSLKSIIRAQSRKQTGCTHPVLGSESWYARQAILEKLKRDFPNVLNIEDVRDLFYGIK
jgi:hypothetical protein